MQAEPSKSSQFHRFAWRYATRSLWRNRRRTLLIIGTVALSVAFSIIGTRYSKAVLKIWEEGAINHGVSHAQLHVKGYFEHPDVVKEVYSFPAAHPVTGLLERDPAVAAVSRRLIFEGIISYAGKSVYFLGRAVDPESELTVSPGLFRSGVDQGVFLRGAGAGADAARVGVSSVAIGRGLAETLGLKLGDDATIMAHTLSGAVNSIDVHVAGILDPPLPDLSRRLIYMDIESGQKALQIPGRYTELAIRLKPGVNADDWVAATRATVESQGLDLRGWWQIDPIIRHAERIWDSVVGVICFLLFMSAGISVLNIIYMLVAERSVEIGTLMAIGARPRDIRILFALEACVIGVLGGGAGAVLGNIVIFGMGWLGVPFDSPFGSGTLMVHPTVNIGVTLGIAVVGICICYIAALAPARKAAQVQPLTAFRGQVT